MRALSILAASALALGIAAGANTADAACKRFGFTVNDYGKEGPTNDAKALLDKHVSKWAAENGVSNYRVGKKDVKCELFLDFVVFDEYTCTASANVCWGGDISKIAPSDNEDVADSEAPPPPVSKVAAGLKREKPAVAEAPAPADENATNESETAAAETTPAAETPEAAVAQQQQEQAAPPVEQAAEEAMPAMVPPTATASVTEPAASADEKPGVSVSAGEPVVETGALGGAASEANVSSPDDKMASTSHDDDRAGAASSAAAAAAAAAERAAAAAETAAAAAKEAAAAAVAASAANRGVIVPPIDSGR